MKKLLIAAGLLMPAVAFAHPGHETTGFASGLAHPFTGMDPDLVDDLLKALGALLTTY